MKIVNFDKLFAETRERPLRYKGLEIVRLFDFPFTSGDQILVAIEETDSEWIQGIALSLFGYFIISGKKFRDKIVLWEHTSPQERVISLEVEPTKRYHSKRLPPRGVLGINNLWDTGNSTIQSWWGGAAMIVEEIENGKRYRCNDGHPDENFDDIVFTIQKITG